ncbi:MAG: hypothetical protein QOF53_3052 [Nocardioidaceae bacterium]|nr:hypothetical protein [Nocardioidaceae bacterium]
MPLGSRTVQSVDRAIGLLRVLAEAEAELSLAELSLRCGLERPTAWRLLWTLESNGLVEKAESSQGYRVAHGWLGLCQDRAFESLVRLAHPVLEDLATDHGVTASLVRVQPLALQYVDQVDSAVFGSPRWAGSVSFHASSPGKAVLACLPDPEWRALVGTRLEKLTDTTITSTEALEQELTTVREHGYAVCRGEDVTYSNGASAVIRVGGRPLAAIDLWGPDRRVPTSRLDELGRAAVAGANKVETALA